MYMVVFLSVSVDVVVKCSVCVLTDHNVVLMCEWAGEHTYACEYMGENVLLCGVCTYGMLLCSQPVCDMSPVHGRH